MWIFLLCGCYQYEDNPASFESSDVEIQHVKYGTINFQISLRRIITLPTLNCTSH